MSCRKGANLVAAVAAVLALSLAANAGAGPTGIKAKGRTAQRHSNAFSLSTEYTGYLSETLTIDHVPYRVASNASIYMIGQGHVPLGTMVYNRSIYITGERVGKDAIVRSIIVRPAQSEAGNPGDSRPVVGVADPTLPR